MAPLPRILRIRLRGDPFADFLLGFAQSTRRQTGMAQAYLRQENYGAYVQDEWRVSRRRHVNLGMRYEYTSPYRESRGNLVNLDYSALPGEPPAYASRSGQSAGP